MLLEGKVVLVTGAARGIGKRTALIMADDGADVGVVDILPEVENTALEIQKRGRRSMAVIFDISDPGQVHDGVQRIVNELGDIDVLVNNAGIHQNEAIWAMDEAQWDEVLDVDLKGTFNYSRAVAPVFRQQRAGKIVNIASIHGLRGRQAGPNYSAAKAGVIGLTKSVARDLGPYGVNVNAVAPGITETDMVRALSRELKDRFVAEIVLGRMGQPEDVAHLVTFLCSDQARHITGEVIKVDGGQYM